MSYISLKSKTFRKFLCGEPTTVIRDGVINQKNMEGLRFTHTDLMEELRQGGCDDIKEVKRAIVETNGKLSIILKEEERPLTKKDARSILGRKSKWEML